MAKKGESKYDFPPIEIVKSLYWGESVAINDIGAMFGVPGDSLRQYCTRLGFKFRSQREAALLAYELGRRPAGSKLPRKLILSCSHCFFVWRNDSARQTVLCPICGNPVDVRIRKSSRRAMDGLKKWRASVDDKESGKRSRGKLRRKVLAVIARGGPVRCARCGCDDIRLLEVNHMNGGGNKEYRHGKFSMQFYYQVVRLERTVDDLNILCKVCNAQHYLEMLYGELPFSIIWNGGST